MIVLFDLDGTLADISHRRHFVEKADKTDADWRAFYAACVDDKVNWPVATMWHALNHGQRWIVSGRSREVEVETYRWLHQHQIFPDRVLMRADGDHQPDVKLKKGWLDDGTIPRAKVLCVFDDRPSVIRMWRSEGLFVFDCGNGEDF
jgi:hypothetical protein